MRAFWPALLLSLIVSGADVGAARAIRQDGLVAVNGTELYVARMGNGEPIVVVHGGPMLEHGYLQPHLALLADSFELVFFDQRLSGRSAPRVDSASVRVATFVEDIEALRVALDLGPIHLLGHSWGGMLTMRYGLRYPQNLRSLILVSPMAASSELWLREEGIVAERVSERDRQEQMRVSGSEAFADGEPEAIAQMLRISMRAQFHNASRLSELAIYVPDDYQDRSAQLGAMGVDLEDFDFHGELERLAVPTLIIYGSAEPGGPIGGVAIDRRLPDSRLVTIPEAGHFPFLEQPQAFLEAVREFLAAR
jgi:proline iminopeptidase